MQRQGRRCGRRRTSSRPGLSSSLGTGTLSLRARASVPRRGGARPTPATGASPKCSDAGLRPRTAAPGGLGLRRAMGSAPPAAPAARSVSCSPASIPKPRSSPNSDSQHRLPPPPPHTAPACPLPTSSQWSRPTPGCRVTCVQSLPPNSASDHAHQGPSGPPRVPGHRSVAHLCLRGGPLS